MTLFSSLLKHVPDISQVLCLAKNLSFLMDIQGRKK